LKCSTPEYVIAALRGRDRVHVTIAVDASAEALMKSYRWLTLIAALLITVCEVLVLTSQTDQVRQRQGNGAAVADVGSGTRALGA
jgi:hypothetical protein